jgi:hypothetical protein
LQSYWEAELQIAKFELQDFDTLFKFEVINDYASVSFNIKIENQQIDRSIFARAMNYFTIATTTVLVIAAMALFFIRKKKLKKKGMTNRNDSL